MSHQNFCTPPHLLHHLVLLVEELHLDVSTHRKRLWELKQHQFVLPPGVRRDRRVDLHLQLVDHKLRVCNTDTGQGPHRERDRLRERTTERLREREM